jgi:hypothetical protein
MKPRHDGRDVRYLSQVGKPLVPGDSSTQHRHHRLVVVVLVVADSAAAWHVAVGFAPVFDPNDVGLPGPIRGPTSFFANATIMRGYSASLSRQSRATL